MIKLLRSKLPDCRFRGIVLLLLYHHIVGSGKRIAYVRDHRATDSVYMLAPHQHR